MCTPPSRLAAPSLIELPDAVLLFHVLPSLGPKSALTDAGSTCVRMRGLATDDALWRGFWSMRGGRSRKLSRLAGGVASALPGIDEGRTINGGIMEEAASWGEGPPDDVVEGGMVAAFREKLLSASYRKPKIRVMSPDGNNLLRLDDMPCDVTFTGAARYEHSDEPVTLWCCWTDCKRARCREECPEARRLAAVRRALRLNGDLVSWCLNPKFYKCSWCRVMLCGGCAHPSDARLNDPRGTREEDASRLAERRKRSRSAPSGSDGEDLVRQCDSCGRGACLDCEKILWLGTTRRCTSTYSFREGRRHEEKCEADLCWKCAWRIEYGSNSRGEKGPRTFSSLAEFRNAEEIYCEKCSEAKWMYAAHGWVVEKFSDAEPRL